jgi:transketolase
MREGSSDPYAAERELARSIRAHSLRMLAAARASHIGTCLSMADLLAVLFARYLRLDPSNPRWEDRDRFLLSKGHGAAAHYAVLAERGYFATAELATYCQDGSRLGGHSSHHVPGVELSTGSLGHALPVACGMAIAAKREERQHRVVALLSDGECDEGSVWEAALFAPQHALDNLLVVIDHNRIQSLGRVDEVLPLEPFEDKWRAFRWGVRRIDGHDLGAIAEALAAVPFEPGRPSVILAVTVKGKGVSFMEDRLEWHYRSPSPAQLAQAIAEIGVSS